MTSPRRSRPGTDSRAPLRRDLDTLVTSGRAALRRRRLVQAIPHALEQGMPLLLLAPAAFLLFRVALLLAAPDELPNVAGAVVLGMVVPFLLYVLIQVGAEAFARTTRREALAVFDDELGLEDRLVTADQFLALEPRTDFHEAALDDAERVVGRALEVRPKVPALEGRMDSWSWLYPLAGALVFVIGLLLSPSVKPRGEVGMLEDPTAEVGRPRDAVRRLPLAVPGRKPETSTATPGSQGGGSRESASRTEPDAGDAAKRAAGRTRSGQAAEAGAPTGSAASRGVPTDQGRPSRGRPPRRARRPHHRDSSEGEPSGARKQPRDRSGATTGRGAAGGSTKNPVSSEWTSRDQVAAADEELPEDDEEVDDESSSSDARGGVQPNLRERRPPSSRDLGIGFGNEPGGDGRGGPSQRKKSRGTASLVLGVPVPDHVKGQLNPGTTKVTRERVEPKPEDHDAVDAAARRPREAPAGAAPRPRMEPWLEAMVRRYFERAGGDGKEKR